MGFPPYRVKSQNHIWNFQTNNIHLQPQPRTRLGPRPKKGNIGESRLSKWDILMWLFFVYTIFDMAFGFYLSLQFDVNWIVLPFQIFFQVFNHETNFQHRLIFFIICTGMCLIKSFILQISMICQKVKKIHKDKVFYKAKCLKKIEEKIAYNCKFTITRFGKPISVLEIIFRFINLPTFLIYIHCNTERKLTIGNFVIPREISILLTLLEQTILIGSISFVFFLINELFTLLVFQNVLNVLFYIQNGLKSYFIYHVFKSNLTLPQWILWIIHKISLFIKKIKRNCFLKFLRKQKKRKRQMTYQEIVQTYRIRK